MASERSPPPTNAGPKQPLPFILPPPEFVQRWNEHINAVVSAIQGNLFGKFYTILCKYAGNPIDDPELYKSMTEELLRHMPEDKRQKSVQLHVEYLFRSNVLAGKYFGLQQARTASPNHGSRLEAASNMVYQAGDPVGNVDVVQSIEMTTEDTSSNEIIRTPSFALDEHFLDAIKYNPLDMSYMPRFTTPESYYEGSQYPRPILDPAHWSLGLRNVEATADASTNTPINPPPFGYATPTEEKGSGYFMASSRSDGGTPSQERKYSLAETEFSSSPTVALPTPYTTHESTPIMSTREEPVYIEDDLDAGVPVKIPPVASPGNLPFEVPSRLVSPRTQLPPPETNTSVRVKIINSQTSESVILDSPEFSTRDKPEWGLLRELIHEKTGHRLGKSKPLSMRDNQGRIINSMRNLERSIRAVLEDEFNVDNFVVWTLSNAESSKRRVAGPRAGKKKGASGGESKRSGKKRVTEKARARVLGSVEAANELVALSRGGLKDDEVKYEDGETVELDAGLLYRD